MPFLFVHSRSRAAGMCSTPLLSGPYAAIPIHLSLARYTCPPRCAYTGRRKTDLNSTTSISKRPSTLSPAQRVRQIAAYTVGLTTLTAVLGVWMRYQGYTIRGMWSWMGRMWSRPAGI
jgi:Ras family protein T1